MPLTTKKSLHRTPRRTADGAIIGRRTGVHVAGKVLERDLEHCFSIECKKRNLLNLKLNVKYSRGWPDRVVVLPNGQTLWIELKTLTGKLSELQIRVHKELRTRGHDVLVLRTKDEIRNVLESARISKESS